MAATLAELAQLYQCELHGPADLIVESVGTLRGAGERTVAFLANPLYRQDLLATRAAAVVLAESDRASCPVAALVTRNPYAVFARIASHLHPLPVPRPGIDPMAAVAADAVVAASASIGPHVSIGSGAVIGEGVVVGAGTVIANGARVGGGSRLAPRVTLLEDCVLGARCVVHSGAVIGADGFGFAREHAAWIKVPQLGRVVVGDDVEIGANTAIDRGTIEDTVVGDGVKLDNLIQVAHNVRIGDHTVVAGFAGFAGSARIGKRCMIGGAVKVVGHIEICDDVMVGFNATVTRSITKPGEYSGCIPVEEASRWRRIVARLKRLDALAERVLRLEREYSAGLSSTQKKDKTDD